MIPLPLRAALCSLVFAALACAAGCTSSTEPEVVVYTAQDAEYAEPIFRDFTAATGVAVRPKFDTESTKTVGLAEAILAERGRPRCDVFWNNEILHTLRLARAGAVEAYLPKLASEYPAEFRAADGTWHGFAARARVLLVNTQRVPQAERPTSIRDLGAARWRQQVGMAKPLFGTTATHAACLFAAWGPRRAQDFFASLRGNVRIMAGNRHVAQAVASGELAFGLTDTDDAVAELERGRPVTIVYPDQQPDGDGTLFIPNTLAVIKNAPHPAQARRLVDALLTPAVEDRLAGGPSAQIPLHPGSKAKVRVATPRTVRAMRVDFAAAASAWPSAAAFLRDRFAAAE